MLSRHQTKPGGKVPCTFEHTDIGDCRRDQGRGDRTDAGDRGQAARGFIVPRVSDNLRFKCLDAFSQCAASWCMETEGRGVFLLGFGPQTIRTETGMPSQVIRLRTLHPIFASVL